MHTHRVEVLNRTNNDAVVLAIPHHLHLVFFPADHRFFDQHFLGRRGIKTAAADGDEFFAVIGNTATGAAERKRRPDDGWKTHHSLHLQRLFEAVCNRRTRRIKPDLLHRLLELLTILGLVDRLFFRADHLDAILVEHAMLGEIKSAIQRGLPTHGRQQRVRTLDCDNFFDHTPGHGLDVGRVSHIRVRHDSGRIRVDQNHAITLFAQRLAGLCARVIEFAGLTDDDRTGADD